MKNKVKMKKYMSFPQKKIKMKKYMSWNFELTANEVKIKKYMSWTSN